MLPFGSFLTSIPLIALAFTYMLFFGANAARRIKPDCTIGVVLEEKQQADVSPESKLNSTLYYNDLERGLDTGTFEEITIISSPESVNILQSGPLDIGHHSHYSRGNTFSRPPPFLQ